MSRAASQLTVYLQYPFVRYALLVGVLVALVAALLGVTLVLRRFSFIGDGLSHVAFGALAVATIMDLASTMVVTLPVTITAAVLLLRRGADAKVKGDAAITMLSVGALAFGYVVMNAFHAGSNVAGDVCTTLFGSTSILTLTPADVGLAAVLSAVVVVAFVMLYNRLLACSFDERFSRVAGVPVNAVNLALSVLIAVVIVLAMSLVGSLLVSALVVFPALSAMRLFKSFAAVTVFSAALSVTCALAGILASILLSTPVGATVVLADAIAFGACTLIGKVKG